MTNATPKEDNPCEENTVHDYHSFGVILTYHVHALLIAVWQMLHSTIDC